MAKIDTADFGSMKDPHANISEAVGIGEKNEKNDVMTIQALFKLVGYSDFNAKKYFNLKSNDLPEPTGGFDEKTIRAVWAFQRTNQGRLLNADGKIHPADYQNRVLKNIFKGARLMTITLLNLYAIDGVVMLPGVSNTPEAVKKIAPSVLFTA
jgi:hypothetical protein